MPAFEETVVHQCHNAQGEPLVTLHRGRDSSGRTSFAFIAPPGPLLTVVASNGASRAFDGAGHELPCQQTGGTETFAAPAPDSDIRQVGENTVMVSGNAACHPIWIIDDYLNHTRHFIFGASVDVFLHVNLDRHGSLTLTEKHRNHATLRVVRRDGTGRLLADEATVQPGESVAAVALRCGVPHARLLALNPTCSHASPQAGIVLRVA